MGGQNLQQTADILTKTLLRMQRKQHVSEMGMATI
jgi:hypothetical protein